jgi:hypothetical protein
MTSFAPHKVSSPTIYPLYLGYVSPAAFPSSRHRPISTEVSSIQNGPNNQNNTSIPTLIPFVFRRRQDYLAATDAAKCPRSQRHEASKSGVLPMHTSCFMLWYVVNSSFWPHFCNVFALRRPLSLSYIPQASPIRSNWVKMEFK